MTTIFMLVTIVFAVVASLLSITALIAAGDNRRTLKRLAEDYLNYKGLAGELILGLRSCMYCNRNTPCASCRTDELFFELEDMMDDHIDKYYTTQEKRDYFRESSLNRNNHNTDIFDEFELVKARIEDLLNSNNEGSFIIYPDGTCKKLNCSESGEILEEDISSDNMVVGKNNRLIKKLNEMYLTDEFEYKGVKIKVKRIGNTLFQFEHDPIDDCTEDEIGQAYLNWLKNN